MSTESIAEENRLPEGASPAIPERIIFPVILALSACHLVNDAVQSVITALYPLLKESLGLDFTRIGLITLTAQLTASICQPVVGLWADRKPMPYALAFGTGFTLTGLFLIAYAASFPLILVAVGLIGIGSAIFHPEASRLAYVAAGQQRGFAQSFFQLGGNGGSSVGARSWRFASSPNGRFSGFPRFCSSPWALPSRSDTGNTETCAGPGSLRIKRRFRP